MSSRNPRRGMAIHLLSHLILISPPEISKPLFGYQFPKYCSFPNVVLSLIYFSIYLRINDNLCTWFPNRNRLICTDGDISTSKVPASHIYITDLNLGINTVFPDKRSPNTILRWSDCYGWSDFDLRQQFAISWIWTFVLIKDITYIPDLCPCPTNILSNPYRLVSLFKETQARGNHKRCSW